MESLQIDHSSSVIITGLVKVILGYVPGSRIPSYSRTEVWTTVHAGMAIVCACLPVLKPLLNRISNSNTVTRLKTLTSHPLSFGSNNWNVLGTRKDCQKQVSSSDIECPFAPIHIKSALQQRQTSDGMEIVEIWPLRESVV